MHRTDFQKLSAARRREAKHLLDKRQFDGAYYLAGYTIELALKAVIAKSFLRHTWPELGFVNKIHTHDLGKLVEFAGLESIRKQEIAADPDFLINWQTVKDWNEQSRYKRWSRSETENLYTAIANRRHGVLRWIRSFW